MVASDRITRRCRVCWHTASEDLPSLNKRIIYLDQNILSNIAKSLDPVWGSQRPEQDPFWTRAFDALDRVVKLQIAVCPSSPIHEQESLVAPHFEILKRLYEYLGVGVEFEFPTLVHRNQLWHAFKAVLAGKPADYRATSRNEMVFGRRDLNAWSDRIQITANIGPATTPDKLRRGRDQSGSAWKEQFRLWREAKTPFEEVYAFERHGFAQTVFIAVRENIEALMKADATGVLSEEAWNPRLEVEVFHSLVHIAENAGLNRQAAMRAVGDFLHSPDAMDAPANDIRALLMAALSRRAVAGQKRPPNRGTWNDFTAIAAYMPYCDAMFVDNECVDLLREGPLKERINYPTRVFSKRTGEDFLSYVQEVEREAGADHRTRVMEVYGESWLIPYRTVLVQERERLAKDR